MKNEECFAIWAPPEVAWSQWAKPVTFTQLNRATGFAHEEIVWECPEIGRVPSPGRTAIVVDAPGPTTVRVGIGLANIGYRPVPLFNATSAADEVLDIDPIAQRLLRGAEQLRELRLGAGAPPAFLLDSQRMRPPVLPHAGKFDNRWVTLPQDFPSATFLRTRGITDALVLRQGAGPPDQDLQHVLRRWQEGGLRIALGDLLTGGDPKTFEVPRPSLFRHAWYRVIAALGLRRSDVGGFGGQIPQQSASGFGGFG